VSVRYPAVTSMTNMAALPSIPVEIDRVDLAAKPAGVSADELHHGRRAIMSLDP